MVKRRGKYRSSGRAWRQVERFDLLVTMFHPPVKGVAARTKWKMPSMSTRLRLAAARRELIQHESYALLLDFERRRPLKT